MQDFNSLTNDYLQLLQSTTSSTGTGNTGTSLSQAYTCAKDLVALLTNQSEQLLLSNTLWNLLGKVIPHTSILSTIASFSSAQFSLGIEGFLKDEALAMGSSLSQAGNPTVQIQTLLNGTTTATPTTTQVPITPTQTTSPTLTPAIRPTLTPPYTETRMSSPTISLRTAVHVRLKVQIVDVIYW